MENRNGEGKKEKLLGMPSDTYTRNICRERKKPSSKI